MVESELGLVPEGWEIRCIQDVCSKILSGRTPERNHDEYWNNGTIQWFKTKELQDGYLLNSEETISDQGLKKSSAKLFPEDTIIIALYAAPTLGRMGILTKPATFNQATCAVIPDQNYISMPFLFIVLLNLRDYFHRIAQGATQQNINVQKLKETPFLLPRKEIVISFTTIILPVFENIRTLTIKNQNLRHTRDLLLPKLISGEIDVSELDIRIPKAEA
jgi:type I restriction enzyme S subunit